MSEGIFDAYTAFRETSYGETLSNNIRYEKYNLSGLSKEAWVDLLGSDVNNLIHMALTYGLAKDFIKTTEASEPGYFSEEEKILLQLAALIHDQGEALTGDISYGDKTDNDEAEELRLFTDNASAFSGSISQELKALVVKARDEVVFDKGSRLGKMFNAIERVGYLRTALRVDARVHADKDVPYTGGLRWLTADVLSNQPLALIGYAEEYPAVNTYLRNQQSAITEAFLGITPEVFLHYGDKAEEKTKAFVESLTAWSDWTNRAGANR